MTRANAAHGSPSPVLERQTPDEAPREAGGELDLWLFAAIMTLVVIGTVQVYAASAVPAALPGLVEALSTAPPSPPDLDVHALIAVIHPARRLPPFQELPAPLVSTASTLRRCGFRRCVQEPGNSSTRPAA
jgi:hypothetical protein